MMDADFGSDTSDDDYIPDGAESEDEVCSGAEEDYDDNEVTNEKKKKSIVKKAKNPLLSELSKSQETVEDNNDTHIECKEVEQKKKKNLWEDFLADVKVKDTQVQKPKQSSWGNILGKKQKLPENQIANSDLKKDNVEKQNVCVSTKKEEKVKVTKIFEFAGEEVRVEEEVSADSAEAIAASNIANKQNTLGSKRPGGISSIVGFLDSKKQKLSTLDKTKLDWVKFKQSQGIEEELEKHKKSKAGYLEKQAFLERADIKQFEIERSLRETKRSKR